MRVVVKVKNWRKRILFHELRESCLAAVVVRRRLDGTVGMLIVNAMFSSSDMIYNSFSAAEFLPIIILVYGHSEIVISAQEFDAEKDSHLSDTEDRLVRPAHISLLHFGSTVPPSQFIISEPQRVS